MKPVELILTNALYDLYGKIDIMPEEFKPQLTAELTSHKGAEQIARYVMAEISREASLAVVMRALVAAGGPSTLTEITQRMQAVKDQQDAHASS